MEHTISLTSDQKLLVIETFSENLGVNKETLAPKNNEGKSEEINTGSLVQIEDELISTQEWVFMIAFGRSGEAIDFTGIKITSVNIQTPLGKNLLGKRVGDSVEFEVVSGYPQKFCVLKII